VSRRPNTPLLYSSFVPKKITLILYALISRKKIAPKPVARLRLEASPHISLLGTTNRHPQVSATAFIFVLSFALIPTLLLAIAHTSIHAIPNLHMPNPPPYILPSHRIKAMVFLPTLVDLYHCRQDWALAVGVKRKRPVDISIMKLIGMEEMASGRRKGSPIRRRTGSP
jgi:hypothetical protein